jgi:phosphatidylinositol alpha-1,6-mannosyltransferase
VVVHGAEITVYGRLWITRPLARRTLRGAAGIVAAGEYVARECVRAAGRPLPTAFIPPGVDPERFVPLDADARRAARRRLGLDEERPLVLGVSRLVPRKGFDVLIDAVAGLDGVQVAIAGTGRDRRRIERRARRRKVDVRFLGRVPDDELPALYGCADVFAMLCRDRWAGLEAEGFGIVFLEAAACAVPSVAGRSGGSHEAVVDGETGFVVPPRDVATVRAAIRDLLADDALRTRMGRAARARVEREYDYDLLVERLAPIARGDLGAMRPFG